MYLLKKKKKNPKTQKQMRNLVSLVFYEIPTTSHFYQSYAWDLCLEHLELNHKNIGF